MDTSSYDQCVKVAQDYVAKIDKQKYYFTRFDYLAGEWEKILIY